MCYDNKMGGQVSKARRACMTDKTSDFSVNGSGLTAGAKISKSYDTGCVQNMLSGNSK